MTFERAFALTNGEEGGYSNRPADRGGITFKGVTQRTFSAWLAANNQEDRDVITMTDAEHKTLAYVLFWKRAQCDDFPERSGCMMYDTAYNSGPANAVRMLQQALGVIVDGVYGPITRAAVLAANDLALLAAYFMVRKAFYEHIVESTPSQAVFLAGWMNRLRDLKAALE